MKNPAHFIYPPSFTGRPHPPKNWQRVPKTKSGEAQQLLFPDTSDHGPLAATLCFCFFLLKYLFIFGCTGSSLQHAGAFVAACGHLSSCGAPALLPRGMWNLPRPVIEPMSPVLEGRFLTPDHKGSPCSCPFGNSPPWALRNPSATADFSLLLLLLSLLFPYPDL